MRQNPKSKDHVGKLLELKDAPRSYEEALQLLNSLSDRELRRDYRFIIEWRIRENIYQLPSEMPPLEFQDLRPEFYPDFYSVPHVKYKVHPSRDLVQAYSARNHTLDSEILTYVKRHLDICDLCQQVFSASHAQ